VLFKLLVENLLNVGLGFGFRSLNCGSVSCFNCSATVALDCLVVGIDELRVDIENGPLGDGGLSDDI